MIKLLIFYQTYFNKLQNREINSQQIRVRGNKLANRNGKVYQGAAMETAFESLPPFQKGYFHQATARPLAQIDGEIKGFLPLLVSLQDQVKLTLPLMFCLLEVDQ